MSAFTIEQISAAHSKVKSGADFPQYIRDLKQLGVVSYETYVIDGHTDYAGDNNYHRSSSPKYDALIIADNSDAATFKMISKHINKANRIISPFVNNPRNPVLKNGSYH